MCIRDRSESECFVDVDEVRLISVSSSGDDTRGTDISKSQGDGDSTAEAGIRCSSNECSMLTWDNVGIGATDLPSLGADGARGAESPLSGAIRGRGTSEYPPTHVKTRCASSACSLPRKRSSSVRP